MKDQGKQILLKNNIKPATMRQLVLSIFPEKQQALSLLEIEKHFENVEISTVFRTLDKFHENCIVHKTDDGTGAEKFELWDEDCSCQLGDLHLHFLITSCGQTQCMKYMSLSKMYLPKGFQFNSANILNMGFYPKCQ